LQVVILAGGLATRMRARFPETPKILLPVGGRPFLDLQVENLVRRGASRLLLCIAHLGDQVRAHVARARFPIPITLTEEGPRLVGTGGALRAALRAGLLDERFVVGFGDSYLPANLDGLMARHAEAGGHLTMTVFRNDDWRIPSNCLVADGRVRWYEKVRALSERPAGARWIDYGLTAMERSFVSSWEHEDPLDLATPLTESVRRGEVAAHEVFARFHEIGSPEGLAMLEDALARGGDPFVNQP
jgi:NDP-sugar pyrophosphorylase family protein